MAQKSATNMTRKPKRSVADAGVLPLLLGPPLVDVGVAVVVDVGLVEASVPVASWGNRGVDMAAWETMLRGMRPLPRYPLSFGGPRGGERMTRQVFPNQETRNIQFQICNSNRVSIIPSSFWPLTGIPSLLLRVSALSTAVGFASHSKSAVFLSIFVLIFIV